MYTFLIKKNLIFNFEILLFINNRIQKIKIYANA